MPLLLSLCLSDSLIPGTSPSVQKSPQFSTAQFNFRAEIQCCYEAPRISFSMNSTPHCGATLYDGTVHSVVFTVIGHELQCSSPFFNKSNRAAFAPDCRSMHELIPYTGISGGLFSLPIPATKSCSSDDTAELTQREEAVSAPPQIRLHGVLTKLNKRCIVHIVCQISPLANQNPLSPIWTPQYSALRL